MPTYPGVSYSFEAKDTKLKKPLIVASYKATERLSGLYEYTIFLRTRDEDFKPEDIIKSNCSFGIKVYEEQTLVHGMLESFEQLDAKRDYRFFKAVLRPRIWKLGLVYTNQVFVEKSTPECIEDVLKANGFKSTDYEFKLNGKMSGFSKAPPYKFDSWKYRKWHMFCQYKETCMHFIQRVCDHEGIYYYFTQEKNQEKIIFCDAMTFQEPHKNADKKAYGKVYYYQDSGFDDPDAAQMIQSLTSEVRTLPKKVILEDYDYLKPSLSVKGEADVDKDGMGQHYSYGDYFETPEEGKRLAKIRAEMYLCQKEILTGRGTCPWFTSGFFIDLSNHDTKSFNQKYLVLEVLHEGTNHSEDEHGDYKNTFRMIPSKTQYRPTITLDRNRIDGSIRATIDATGSGKYAELDEHGRYKVEIPFDEKDRQEGKASAWLRMAQPHAGEKEGMHFPLHKGTEVLLSFLNGDPSRPIIVNAIPNADTKNVVHEKNMSMHVILTRGDNYFEMEDKEKALGILMRTPQRMSYTYWGVSREKMGEGVVSGTEGKRVEWSMKGYYRTVTVDDAKGEGHKFPEVKSAGLGVKSKYEAFDTNIVDFDKVKDCIVSNVIGERYIYRKGADHIFGPCLEVNYGRRYVENRVDGKEGEAWPIPSTAAKFDKNLVDKTWGEVISYQNGNTFDWVEKCKSLHHLKRYHEWYESDDKAAGKGAKKDSGKGVFVNKYFGDVYTYNKGKTKEISEGDFAKEIYGKTKVSIEGKTEIKIKGDTKIEIDGKTDFKVKKDLKVTVMGKTTQTFMKPHKSTYMKDYNVTAMKKVMQMHMDKTTQMYSKDVMRMFQKTQIEVDKKPFIAKRDTMIQDMKMDIGKMKSSIKNISGVNMMKAGTHLLM